MRIEKIEWLCEDAKEAILTISDGEFSCDIFCHPCDYKKGELIQSPILSLEEKQVIKIEEKQLSICRNDDNFGYRIIADVLGISNRLVRVGNIIIQLSLPLPKDIKVSDRILFCTSRLDAL